VSRVDAARNAVVKLQLEVTDTTAKRDSLRRELEDVPKLLSVDAAGPQVIIAGKSVGPLGRLQDARDKLAELRVRFTDLHPDVIALRAEIAHLEAQAAKPAVDGGKKNQIANPLYDQVKIRIVEAETALASVERRLKQAEEDQQALEEKAKSTPGVQAQAQ